jgi:hypothetical protein
MKLDHRLDGSMKLNHDVCRSVTAALLALTAAVFFVLATLHTGGVVHWHVAWLTDAGLAALALSVTVLARVARK